jgi:hypothetical protein
MIFFQVSGIKMLSQNGFQPHNSIQTIIKTNPVILVFILLFGIKFLRQSFKITMFNYNNLQVTFRSFNNNLHLHLSKLTTQQ